MKTISLPSGVSRLLPMIAISIGLGTAAAVAAPQKTVNISLANKRFGVETNPMTLEQKSINLFAKSGRKNIILSTSYRYKLSGNIHGTGDLAGFVAPGTSLEKFLEDIKPGSSDILSDTISTTNGTLIAGKTIEGTQNLGFFTAGVKLTVKAKISDTGVINLSISNIKVTSPFPVTGTIVFDAKTATTPGAKFTVTSL